MAKLQYMCDITELCIQQNNEIEELESVCMYTEETEDKWSETYFHKFY